LGEDEGWGDEDDEEGGLLGGGFALGSGLGGAADGGGEAGVGVGSGAGAGVSGLAWPPVGLGSLKQFVDYSKLSAGSEEGGDAVVPRVGFTLAVRF
jgi:hypothetical protein